MDCFAALAMTVDIASHSRGAIRPRFASSFAPLRIRGRREDRVLAAPAVSRAICANKSCTRAYRAAEHSGLPCAMALRLTSCSSRRTALLPRVRGPRSEIGLAEAPAPRRQNRTDFTVAYVVLSRGLSVLHLRASRDDRRPSRLSFAAASSAGGIRVRYEGSGCRYAHPGYALMSASQLKRPELIALPRNDAIRGVCSAAGHAKCCLNPLDQSSSILTSWSVFKMSVRKTCSMARALSRCEPERRYSERSLMFVIDILFFSFIHARRNQIFRAIADLWAAYLIIVVIYHRLDATRSLHSAMALLGFSETLDLSPHLRPCPWLHDHTTAANYGINERRAV